MEDTNAGSRSKLFPLLSFLSKKLKKKGAYIYIHIYIYIYIYIYICLLMDGQRKGVMVCQAFLVSGKSYESTERTSFSNHVILTGRKRERERERDFPETHESSFFLLPLVYLRNESKKCIKL